MERDFLKWKIKGKKQDLWILGLGTGISLLLGVRAYKEREISAEQGLHRQETGEGAYEQELIASVDSYGKTRISVTVEERILSEEEADQLLQTGAEYLDNLILGDNESLSHVTKNLNFVGEIPEIPVEVMWNAESFNYLSRDGSRKEGVQILEPTNISLSAILYCQEYSKDYRVRVTLMPIEAGLEAEFAEYIREQTGKEGEFLHLPVEYDGSPVLWQKPMDYSFLYFFLLMILAVIFLKIGKKRDLQKERNLRKEEMERDYAQVVSKFTMLLSAGLSIRNAWERIVLLYQKVPMQKIAVYEEMALSFREMQKGISEIKVYETFGERVGEVHYKKLMALFISDRKRGNLHLMDAMNQEMLSAWEEQKRKTRQQGEVIGTKLLLPMMGMLAVVFIMILIPAFLSFRM